MAKKNKLLSLLPLKPLFIKDKKKTTGVLLKYDVYTSVMDELKKFESRLKSTKKIFE